MYEWEIDEAFRIKHNNYRSVEPLIINGDNNWSTMFSCPFCDHNMVIKDKTYLSPRHFDYLGGSWSTFYYFCPFCGKTYRGTFGNDNNKQINKFTELCWETTVNNETTDDFPIEQYAKGNYMMVKETNNEWITITTVNNYKDRWSNNLQGKIVAHYDNGGDIDG